MEFNRNHDERVRGAAFEWLAEQISILGDVLPRTLLAEGFLLGENRVRFVGPQGIFKPAVMQIPLSITSSPKGPYDDAIGQDNLLRYKYRGTDPSHRDNVGLRVALQSGLPLVYFHGIVPGRYMAMWPVYAVNDSPTDLEFSFALDEAIHADLFSQASPGDGGNSCHSSRIHHVSRPSSTAPEGVSGACSAGISTSVCLLSSPP